MKIGVQVEYGITSCAQFNTFHNVVTRVADSVQEVVYVNLFNYVIFKSVLLYYQTARFCDC